MTAPALLDKGGEEAIEDAPNSAIAKTLFITEATVKSHLVQGVRQTARRLTG